MTKTQRIEQLEQRVVELIQEVERLKMEMSKPREAEFYQPLKWAQSPTIKPYVPQPEITSGYVNVDGTDCPPELAWTITHGAP